MCVQTSALLLCLITECSSIGVWRWRTSSAMASTWTTQWRVCHHKSVVCVYKTHNRGTLWVWTMLQLELVTQELPFIIFIVLLWVCLGVCVFVCSVQVSWLREPGLWADKRQDGVCWIPSRATALHLRPQLPHTVSSHSPTVTKDSDTVTREIQVKGLVPFYIEFSYTITYWIQIQ